MRNKYFIPFLLFLTIESCNTPDVLEKKIIGKWSLDKVFEYNNDVTEKHNPKRNRWIEFNKDSSFVSDGDPFGRNTGRWKVDNKNSILYIDSDVDDDDSEWKVILNDDEMIWTGIGHPRKENTRLIHKREMN
jgi:Domain of unknown function (DUF5004)